MNPGYNFRIIPEIGWAVAIAVAIALAEAFVGFDETIFTGDPGAWTRLLIGSLVRAIGGAVLTVLTKGAFLGPGQLPDKPTSG